MQRGPFLNVSRPDNVIYALEMNLPVGNFTPCNVSKYSLHQQLDDMLFWFNNGFVPKALMSLSYSSNDELKKYQEKILMVEEKITCLRKSINKKISSNEKSVYTFVCNTCLKTVSIPRTDKFWSVMQDHEHIETELFNHLNSQKYSKQLIDCVLKPKLNSKVVAKMAVEETIKKATVEAAVKNEIIKENIPEITKEKIDKSENIQIKKIINEKQLTTVSSNTLQNAQNHKINDMNPHVNNFKAANVDKDQISDYLSTQNENFYFNFQINYPRKLEQLIYPRSIMDKVQKIESIKMYTMQKRDKGSVCLLCHIEIPQSVYGVCEHVTGRKHMNQKTEGNIFALRAYHSSWLRQELEYQAHTTFFLPYSVELAFCNLCFCYVYYKHLIHHIDDTDHRNFVLSLFTGGCRNNIPLINLQVSVYKDINVTCNLDFEEVNSLSESSDVSSNLETPQLEVEKNSKKTETSPKEVKQNQKHFIVRSILKEDSKDISEVLESRFLPHLKFLTQEDKIISCSACNIVFEFNLSLLHQHLHDTVHLKLTCIPKLNYSYYCYVCNLPCRTQGKWNRHLKTREHVEKCEKMKIEKKSDVIEYECKTCRHVFFGDNESPKKHRLIKISKKNKEIILNEKAMSLLKSEAIIIQNMENMIASADKVISNYDDVKLCCNKIEEVLSGFFGCICKAYPFGSRVTGLTCNEQSDLDVYVDLGEMYDGNCFQDPISQENIVKKCAKLFRKKHNEFSHVNCIPTARTPIVQVFHKTTKIDCDLSFKNGLSVENTKYLQFCVRVQPVTQMLILYLKLWLKATKMDEKITTYALAMMVIFFLQSQKLSTSISSLKQATQKPLIIVDGWEAVDFSDSTLEYFHKKETIKSNRKIKDLLKDFFKFYVDYDFDKLVVCPLLGISVAKSAFNDQPNGALLPTEMKTYVNKINSSKQPEIFRSLSPLCIQDPFDLSHNLTKGCCTYTVEVLKKLFALSFAQLASIPE